MAEKKRKWSCYVWLGSDGIDGKEFSCVRYVWLGPDSDYWRDQCNCSREDLQVLGGGISKKNSSYGRVD